MNSAVPRRILAAAVLIGTLFGAAACSTDTDTGAEPAAAATTASAFTKATRPTVITHFSLTGGQLPENIVAASDGGIDVTFAAARQIAHVSTSGTTTVIATLPAPKDTSVKTPVLGFPLATGLVRQGSTFYALYATGENATTGLWKIAEGGTPVRIAALPGTGLPNGLALDTSSKTFYAADSVDGDIVSIPLAGGKATVWSKNTALRTTGFLGVNGVKIHDGDVYSTNLDLGTVVRIPIRKDGSSGHLTTVASGLKGIDDFAFTGRGDQIVAAIDPASTVVTISSSGKHRTVLTAADGLSNPTSILVQGSKLWVPSAAYATQKDPNLLTATLN